MTSLLSLDDLRDLAALAGATPPGDFVEVGVYTGGSATILYDLAQQQGRTLYLCDTWAGHPAVSDYDDPQAHWPGRFQEAADALAALRLDMPDAVFLVGTFPATWHAAGVHPSVAFVHADADLYAPTKALCEIFPPLMPSGGCILFDDYPFDGCPGVRLAMQEVFGSSPELRPTGKAVWRKP